LKHVIFYSWQSDLDAALTRNFIEDALVRAAKSINKDEQVSVEAVIDRDTSGVTGTPGISETIFRKIDECDVFVCDISIINSNDSLSDAGLFREMVRAAAKVALEGTFKYRRIQRRTPNPNVLLELGYAVAKIGWDRVILVQNTAYGELESLPFDLRGRRIVPFNLSSKESRPDERPRLRDQLESALRNALAGMLKPTVWVGQSVPRWFGFWHTPDRPARLNALLIREVGVLGFQFHLSLIDGARTGSIAGFAKFTGPDSAYASVGAIGDRKPCELKFLRDFNAKIRRVTVSESIECNQYKGLGATFDGTYICDHDLLFDYGALNELDLQRLYSITGTYYKALIERFQAIGQPENHDKFVATVYSGGAKGLFRSYSAVVMRGESGQLWAAYTDKNVVRYFTTELKFKNKLPETINQWKESLEVKELVYTTEVETIPDF
jgi:hypothetical protein